MDELAKCPRCGSNLAANGECPDCDAPAEEPPWLDDYGYRGDEPAAGPAVDPGQGESRRKGGPPSGRILSFPKTRPRTPTIAELYDRVDWYPELTPERAREMIDIIESVSKALNETQPPRLEWLRRIAKE